MNSPHTQAESTSVEAPTRRLVGWRPAGMLDWPGRVTTTIFLGGCDFRCPFCHNGQLVTEPAECADWNALAAHLIEKRDWLDGVVITGGEPTTDPALRTVLEALSELDMPVKLDTNGNHPEIVAELIAEGLVAFVALDIKSLRDRYDAVSGVEGSGERVTRTIESLIGSGIAHEFRTTAYPGAVALDDFAKIAQTLRGGDRYAIQQFQPDNAMDPRAVSVLPYHADELAEAVIECRKYLPTALRGA